MTGFWTPLVLVLQRFFLAWGQSLVQSAPAGMRHHLVWSKPSIDIAASELLGSTEIQTAPGNNVDLTLDKGLRLYYRFSVPDCAGSELSRVVAMEAERILPVSTKKLLIAYKPTRTTDAAGRIEVDLVAAKKSLVADLMARIQAKGATVTSLRAATDKSQEFVEFSIRDILFRKYAKAGAGFFLVLIALMLVGQVTAIYSGRLEEEIHSIDQQVYEARAATRQVAALQSQMRERRGLSEAIAELKRRNRMTLLLEALTKNSPDDVVLETLRIDRNRLQISGVATDPENWAIALDDEFIFEDVVLLSVRDQETGSGQRFEIRLNVLWDDLWGQR